MKSQYRRSAIRGLMWMVAIGAVGMSTDDLHADEWATVAEQTNYVETATYDETVDYYRRLDAASPWVHVTTFGESPQGREMHLVIVSSDGAFTPEAVKQSGKVSVLIQNGIHAGEIDGKDACMALLRDLVITKERAELLDNVILLIVPIFSVDGHENRVRNTRPNQDGPRNSGFRGTAQRLNLNRDYLKCDAPEMQHWVRMWRRWMPDFFIDDHVTDGHDWPYTVTYTMPWHPNSTEGVRSWVKQYFDSSFTHKVTAAGYQVFPYASPFRGDIANGVRTFVSTPRFSTGYTALWNRPGLLMEMHSLKDYQSRVRGNYAALVAVMEILNADGAKLQEASRAADLETKAGLTEPYPLTFEMAEDSVIVDIATYAFSLDSSVITGGTYRHWDRSQEATIRAPYFGVFRAKESVVPPRAYLIPREWTGPIELLRLHGVEMDTLTQPLTTMVERYHFDSVRWDQRSFESHVRVNYQTTMVETTMTFPIGTVVIDLHQAAAKVIMQALEPKAPDSFIAWGLWSTIFERKEYIADYMVEPMADSMLKANPAMRAEYEARIASDTVFAHSVSDKRNFFYKRSRFYEHDHNWYPVSRLMPQTDFVPTWSEWNK